MSVMDQTVQTERAHVSVFAIAQNKSPFEMSDQDRSPIDQDDEYKSSEDEDFNPDAVEAPPDDDLSSDEDEAPQPKKVSKKRKKAQADAEELDSGDEATITELRKAKKSKADDDEDSGGEGGLIKTRAQRRAEYVKCRYTTKSMLMLCAENRSVKNTRKPTPTMLPSTSTPCGPRCLLNPCARRETNRSLCQK